MKVKESKNRVSTTKICDLKFSVYLVARMLKSGKFTGKITKLSAIYLTAVLEYIVAEVLELAVEETIRKNKKRITPSIISSSIISDHEILKLFQSKILLNVKSKKVSPGWEVARDEEKVLDSKINKS